MVDTGDDTSEYVVLVITVAICVITDLIRHEQLVLYQLFRVSQHIQTSGAAPVCQPTPIPS